MKKYAVVLSIAGSDSGGGAGIQADIKSISANGGFACTAITALTAQNTQGVTDIFPVSIEHLKAQLDAVFSDIEIDAVKIGMLHSPEVITTVVESLKNYQPKHIVVDPVMVATSGDRLLMDEAIESLKSELLPLASLITPNLPEAEILFGSSIENITLSDLSTKLGEKFGVNTYVKAGHLTSEELVDALYLHKDKKIALFSSQRIETNHTHGTGCSLSAAMATYLAHGNDIETSCKMAKQYLHEAIKSGKDYQLGKGNGPIDHFWNQRDAK